MEVPTAKSEHDFYQKAKEQKWIEKVMTQCVSTGEVKDGTQCFMEYLLRRHVGTTHDALQELGVMPSIMNEYQIAATLAQAKIGIGQWREIVKCLKSYSGIGKDLCCRKGIQEAW